MPLVVAAHKKEACVTARAQMGARNTSIDDSLKKKYGADNAGKKKYVVEKWIKFQMVDDKPIMEQVHEYENLTADVLNEGMEMCEILQANALLEKFLPSLSDYRNQLKHKKKNLTLQKLISHMRTEEANRLKDEAKSMFLKYKAEVENQLDRKIKRLRSDRGGEYILILCKPFVRIVVLYMRLSRYTHNPSNEHWNALHRLLMYLRGTMDMCLHFNKFSAVLEGFCDANWVTNNDEVSFTSGYMFTLSAGAISWKSSKQTCIARFTMEFEFIALEMAGQEAEWMRNLVADMPLWGR
ncbi:uncharacterized protein [Nicotiana tomentosiformis]|uniref:uncharacterized protein n=1 Tax=Nicotiana tomentosiformis TaxID=4098 RepID=UPI00388C43AA